jgi:hypothetical protein
MTEPNRRVRIVDALGGYLDDASNARWSGRVGVRGKQATGTTTNYRHVKFHHALTDERRHASVPQVNIRKPMSDHIYRVTEVVGTSTEGIDAAISAGIERASTSLHGLDWFQVTETRGHIVDGRVAHYQVGLKVGFRLDQD